MDQETNRDTVQGQPQWQPLSSRQRRVLGVLVEKAKTTPDAYPLTLNALTNGCNQKSNRNPQMDLKADEVESVLEELRAMGAVAEVQAGGRVPKYRHYMYEWLGVDKYEIAVMTELLLRGEQTVGELRGRASRMEPIADLNALRPILQSLITKRLVVSLTPEGRGQIVTHALYKPREMEELRARVASAPASDSNTADSIGTAGPRAGSTATDHHELIELRSEVEDLRAQLDALKAQIRELTARREA